MKSTLLFVTLLTFSLTNAMASHFSDYSRTPNLDEVLQDTECVLKKSQTKCDANATFSGFNAWCRQDVQVRLYNQQKKVLKIIGNANSDRSDVAGWMTVGLSDLAGKSFVTKEAKREIKEKIGFISKCE